MLELSNEIEKMVLQVRQEIINLYEISDTPECDNRNFRGTCDDAVIKLIAKFRASRFKNNYQILGVHGEQRHSLSVAPNNWHYEHSWAVVSYEGKDILYVDPTCQQFQWLHADIPRYYIYRYPPRWFLPDNDNLYWRCYRNSIYLSKVVGFFQTGWYYFCQSLRWLKLIK